MASPGPTHPAQTAPPAETRQQIAQAYGRLPLSFEANRGQTDSSVKFLARGRGYALYLTADEAVLTLRQGRPEAEGAAKAGPQLHPPALHPTDAASATTPEETKQAVVRMKLLGSTPGSEAAGLEQLPGTANYFIGNDPSKWHTNIPTYAKVRYAGVYPGVDLVYYGNQGQLEYDLVVGPGADPNQIRLAFEGAEHLTVDEQGDLLLQVAGGELRLRKPQVYQEIGGAKHTVAARYVLQDMERAAVAVQVGVQVATYDVSRPLIIDPVLVYSTYLGGSLEDGTVIPGEPPASLNLNIAVDSLGNATVTGTTYSVDFPVTSGPTTPPGNGDGFVARLDATGSNLLCAAYFGGSGYDEGHAIALDGFGNAYVTGRTTSSDFPVTPGVFDTVPPTSSKAHVSKFDGSCAPVYSTYLGGSAYDWSHDITVDGFGNVYVTGGTVSADFPTTPGAVDTTCGTDGACNPTVIGTETWTFPDAYVVKLKPDSGNTEAPCLISGVAYNDCADLIYSTFLGGSSNDNGNGIAVDGLGRISLVGFTASTDLQTLGAYSSSCTGMTCSDGFMVKMNPAGGGAGDLLYGTYLGGSGDDILVDIVADSSGHAYVAGRVTSSDFPTTSGAYDTTFNGVQDSVLVKLNPSTTGAASLVYSTYLGGSGDDDGHNIAVDAAGNIYTNGGTTSADFPTTSDALSNTLNGSTDAYVVELRPDGLGTADLKFSTYLGGSGVDRGHGVDVDAAGNIYVTGTTSSPFPVTSGAYDTTYNGGTSDVFVAKIGPPSLNFITVTPVDPTINVGQPQPFMATGTFSDGSTQVLSSLDQVTAVTAGGFHTCVRLSDGTVKCWGNNLDGQLGDGSITNSPTPVEVSGISTATAIAAGGPFSNHTCAVLSNGTVKCWGPNSSGQLGDGSFTNSPTPVEVSGISTATAIAAGGALFQGHTCALLSAGTVKCWGNNLVAQLGNGTVTTPSATPVEVSGISTATAVAAGSVHTCARLSDGTMQCWGSNGYGQLGDGTVTTPITPVEVSGISTAIAIAAGDAHTCAVLSNGTVKCWGTNFSGELGDGSFTNSPSPMAVSGISAATAVAAGGSGSIGHTCARLSDSTVKCWGRNALGQLGNGTTTISSSTPVAVIGAVLWTSINTAVATIQQTGLVTALSTGTTTITATSSFNPSISGSTTLTVVPPPLLSVSKSGTGSGVVTSDPAGIDCGIDCSAAYASGTSVALTATPAAGSAFVGWSGACTGTGACTVTLTADTAVTATFNLVGLISRRKPVTISTNGVFDSSDGHPGEFPSDVTDGSLKYEPVSSGREDGSLGWQNVDFNEKLVVNVTINLQGTYRISTIRYNMGNVGHADSWNADRMITPFSDTTTNPGSSSSVGAWTAHTGDVVASTVTVTLEKTKTSFVTDWLFIGEIEVYGAPVTVPNTPPVLGFIGNKTLNEGVPFSYTVSATDGNPADSLTYSASGLPLGASFSGSSFTWTPDSSRAGIYYDVLFEVSDGQGGVDSEEIAITVTDTIVDSDLDGVPDDIDNCDFTPNPDQADVDGDGVGDVCDNCPNTKNGLAEATIPGVGNQLDSDGNGVGDACEGQVTTETTISPPASSAGYAVGEPISVTATVTFDPIDFGGTTPLGPDPYYALRPNPYNVILRVKDSLGNEIVADRILEGPPIALPVDLAGIPTISSRTFRTEIPLTEWFTHLQPDKYTVEATYVNFAKDPELKPDGTCPTLDGCFAPIWPGIAPAGTMSFTIGSQCPPSSSNIGGTGCPVADKNMVTLHTVNLGGGASTKAPLPGAQVRVFDRNSTAFQLMAGSKNPDGSLYGKIFEMDKGRVGTCVTDGAGVCFAGEAAMGEYLVIVKYFDSDPQGDGTVLPKTVYVGTPKGPADFVDTNGDLVADLATKAFQIMKIFKQGVFQGYRGGSKMVVTGSILEMIVPESAIWEGTQSVYPFIFTSDSAWTVDICAQVLPGYSIVGVYDANGNLIASTTCVQTIVANETKIVAFEVKEVGSPEPKLSATLTLKSPKGKIHVKQITASDIRRHSFDAAVVEAKAKTKRGAR